MKDIAVSQDADSYRNAHLRAVAPGTSVSALVKRYLTELGAEETEFLRLKRDLRERIPADFRAADRLSRNEVHERQA